jgi:hypothetical protein
MSSAKEQREVVYSLPSFGSTYSTAHRDTSSHPAAAVIFSSSPRTTSLYGCIQIGRGE